MAHALLRDSFLKWAGLAFSSSMAVAAREQRRYKYISLYQEHDFIELLEDDQPDVTEELPDSDGWVNLCRRDDGWFTAYFYADQRKTGLNILPSIEERTYKI